MFTLPVAGNLEFNHVAPALGACLDGLGFGMFLSYQWRRTWRKAA